MREDRTDDLSAIPVYLQEHLKSIGDALLKEKTSALLDSFVFNELLVKNTKVQDVDNHYIENYIVSSIGSI